MNAGDVMQLVVVRRAQKTPRAVRGTHVDLEVGDACLWSERVGPLSLSSPAGGGG